MSRKNFTALEKLRIIAEYNDGDLQPKEVARKYDLNVSTLKKWRLLYEESGAAGLEPIKNHKSYSAELKQAAVHDYLSGGFSQSEVTRKYGISTRNVLMGWVELYNGHKALKDDRKGLSRSMTKGKNVCFEEKVEIVKDCLAHGKDYARSMEVHKVSYAQIYSWVRKYLQGGEEALQDNRGKQRTEEELTKEEKEMKKLKRENERLRAENAFLKKLEEIERRRY
ncbi:Transposase and inactivated derivatives [Salipaludibacillus aurantiacus]|uniref:Transposase and inactivated derivatives n=1 Tax=Salipaludibacillus aurantiacus TaxID=1601833 RepID=A0A1H9UN17_9BACI|nr:Transposase and inactivated derivatives [Salipaludibacillus aurantiacus]